MKKIFALLAMMGSTALVQGGTTQSFSNGSGSVTFSMVGESLLQVTLTNISASSIVSASDLLTGVSFQLNQSASLSTVSAALGPNSTLLNCSGCNTDLSAQWGYTNQAGFLGNLIGASDFGLLTAANSFKAGSNIAFGGADYGITGNINLAQQLSTIPTVNNQVVFILSASQFVDVSLIGSVGFFYGQQLFNGYSLYLDTPEPSAVALMTIGLAALVLRARGGRRQTK